MNKMDSEPLIDLTADECSNKSATELIEELIGGQLNLRPNIVFKTNHKVSQSLCSNMGGMDGKPDLDVLKQRHQEISHAKLLLEEEDKLILSQMNIKDGDKSKVRTDFKVIDTTESFDECPNSRSSPNLREQSSSVKGDASQLHKSNDLLELTDAIKVMAASMQRGPLPVRTLTKFDGSALEFHKFKTEFRNNIMDSVMDASTRLNYLMNLCTGKAYEAIRSCVVIEPPEKGFEMAISILDEQFGQRHRIVHAHLDTLTIGDNLPDGDHNALFKLWTEMNSCYNTLIAFGCSNYLEDANLIEKLYRRLPKGLQVGILRDCRIKISEGQLPRFAEIMHHVDIAAKLRNTSLGQIAFERDAISHSTQNISKDNRSCEKQIVGLNTSGIINMQSSRNLQQNTKYPSTVSCLLCENLHHLYKCEQFMQCTPHQRFDIVKKRGACFNCLVRGHTAGACFNRRRCQSCGYKHHSLLHFQRSHTLPSWEPKVSSNQVLTGASNAIVDISKRTRFRVLPVEVWSADRNCSVLTYAFLDSGASHTMCKTSLLNKLMPTISPRERIGTKFTIKTLNHSVDHNSCLMKLSIKGLYEQDIFSLGDVLVVPELPDVHDSIPTQKDKVKYPHLRNLHFPCLNLNEVELLIGSDNELATEEISRRRMPGCPTAIRTRLGWTLNGVESNNASNDTCVSVNCCKVGTQTLHQQHEHMSPHNLCENKQIEEVSLSMEDQQMYKSMDESTTKDVNGPNKIRLPSKLSKPIFADDQRIVKRRHNSPEKKFMHDLDLFDKYKNKMRDYRDNRNKVPDYSTVPAERIWYNPHQLLQGPEHTNKLTRFQQEDAKKNTTVADCLNVITSREMTESCISQLSKFLHSSGIYPIKYTRNCRCVLSFLPGADRSLKLTCDSMDKFAVGRTLEVHSYISHELLCERDTG